MALGPNSRAKNVSSLGLFGPQAQKQRELQQQQATKNAAQTVSEHIGSQNGQRVSAITTQLDRVGSTQAADMIRAAANQAQRQAKAEQPDMQSSRSMGRPG